MLYHGAAGVMILKFTDHGADIITIDSTLRGEELKAEIKADSAAYGIYKKLMKLFGSTTNTENWRRHKGNIKIMWDTKFCN